MSQNGHETEIKLAVPNVLIARRLLRKAGFRIAKHRVFETNIVFDTPDQRLRKTSQLLRLRQAGRKAILTYKGRPTVSRHKSREELELEIANMDTMTAILDRLGFHPIFRYEKYRTEYRRIGAGVATVDETPIGVFFELEGSPRWIDRMAHKLGFSEKNYITGSYARLYMDWCKRCRVKPSNMVF